MMVAKQSESLLSADVFEFRVLAPITFGFNH